ncbi:MAG: biotin--[acetyl-CoA-carboxylase] ligase, partial [Bacteroidota bacterium]
MPQCHSTNVELMTLADHQNLPDGTLLHTEFQLAGKGQRGNIWESERGKNLLFSILFNRPAIPVSKQFIIGFAACLAVFDALTPFCNGVLKVKWPNDIY